MLDVGIIPVKGTGLWWAAGLRGLAPQASGRLVPPSWASIWVCMRSGTVWFYRWLRVFVVDRGACADNMAALAEPPFPASGAKEPK